MTEHRLAPTRCAPWLPSLALIGTDLLELRRRRVLMAVTVAFTVAVPVIFYAIREITHVADPARYGPAGATSAFATVVTLMSEFGFIWVQLRWSEWVTGGTQAARGMTLSM